MISWHPVDSMSLVHHTGVISPSVVTDDHQAPSSVINWYQESLSTIISVDIPALGIITAHYDESASRISSVQRVESEGERYE